MENNKNEVNMMIWEIGVYIRKKVIWAFIWEKKLYECVCLYKKKIDEKLIEYSTKAIK